MQVRSLRRRGAVLEAAKKRFGKDGYERASIRDIARDADVATGAVYQFFRSKRELLLVLMDMLLQRLESFPPPAFGSETVRSDLERFLNEVFSRERPFVGVYRAWQEASLIDAQIALDDRRIRTWTRARIVALFERLSHIPGARTNQDLTTLASLWDRFFWNLLADPPPDTGRAVGAVAATLHRTFFRDTASGERRQRPRRRPRIES